MFATSDDKFSPIALGEILDFINDGGNLILATNDRISEEIRLFAAAVGAEFEESSRNVMDHFSYESTLDVDFGMQHEVILTHDITRSIVYGGDSSGSASPILYRGVGHVVDDENILAVSILRGNPSTYSVTSLTSNSVAPVNTGANSLLVTGMQARNNARLLISGSVDMFSNTFFQAKYNLTGMKVGNEYFCSEIVKWTFRQKGVLRFRDIEHHKSDGTPPDVILHEKERPDLPTSLYPDPEITRNSLVYRIKDQIVYSIVVDEYTSGEWKPYVTNDMQLEFVMLDPYVRKTMVCDPTSGRYTVSFTAPDDYGVFKFRVHYRRPGYTVIHAETQISIRPYKHDEYDRFIIAAFPYYSSSFSMMMSFFLFSVLFLFSSTKRQL